MSKRKKKVKATTITIRLDEYCELLLFKENAIRLGVPSGLGLVSSNFKLTPKMIEHGKSLNRLAEKCLLRKP